MPAGIALLLSSNPSQTAALVPAGYRTLLHNVRSNVPSGAYAPALVREDSSKKKVKWEPSARTTPAVPNNSASIHQPMALWNILPARFIYHETGMPVSS